MGNLTQCKICNSKYTAKVNEMLGKKVTQAAVAAWLLTKGLKLSDMSVSRHHNNCVKGKKKPTKHQKGKVVKMTAASKKTAKKAKDNLKDMKEDPNKVLNKQSKKFQEIIKEENEGKKKKLKGFDKILHEMTDDVNVVNEMVWLMAVGKDRVHRALGEEKINQLVLATTGKAIADYGKLVKDFNEITTGMDSLSSMRFAQFASMMMNIFGHTALTDQTRKELLDLIVTLGIQEEEGAVVSLLPQNIKKPQVVKIAEEEN